MHVCSFRRHQSGMPEWRPAFLTREMSASLISVTIVNLFVSPCAVFLNVLVIVAIKTTPQLRNKYNGLLACLAGTDLLTALFSLPLFVAKQIYRLTGSLSSDYCRILYIDSIIFAPSVIASLQHLTLLSIERYIAIKYPYIYDEIITKPRLVGAVLTVWSFVVFPYSISSFLSNVSGFFIVFRAFTLIPSICILVFCHITVYHEARKQMQKIKTQQHSAEAKEKFLKEQKALKTTTIVLGAVLASSVPLTLFRTVLQSRISSPVVPFLSFALWNSVCNPLIYCVRSKEYRKAFKKLLRLKQNQVQPVAASTGAHP